MIILLNGSINSGKSTVAKILSEKIKNVALLEIDVFHEMIEWMPIDQAVPINLENAVSVISNFNKRGLSVIVPYPLSQKNYEYMIENIKNMHQKVHTFTLSPKLENALTNRGDRELTDQEKDRIKHHYDIGIPSPDFGEIIDNSNMTPQETVNYILSKINEL